VTDKTITVVQISTGIRSEWTVQEILNEINRDRSENWEDYTVEDWEEGWNQWCEGDIWKIVKREDDERDVKRFVGSDVWN
tara:strand:+ start:230 stop:469 length:240 start_codon:yes stop_codon:yes gene_type:complete